ncbi:MAG: ThiJ/PfpI family protein [Pedosphaera sp.]|nr:ThiJ/PfpI family protein [Pedosphaera sp.]
MARGKLQGMRVAVIAADGFEQVEVTSPVSALQRQGAVTEIISLRPGNIKGMNLLWPGKKVHVDRAIFTADADDYDALLIPGGFINPDFLRQSERVLNFVREFEQAKKPIAVICHGPWVLASAGLVKGRTLTSWPGIKDDVSNAGGIWKDKAVVRDDNWVSSQGPLYLLQFNPAMVSLFAEHRAARLGVPAGGRDGEGLTPTLGLLAAGAVLAAIIYGRRRSAEGREVEEPAGNRAASRRRPERESMVTPEI